MDETAVIDGAPRKVLFAHTPKAAGTHLIDYFERELGYPRIQSSAKSEDGVWLDFTTAELCEQSSADHAFLNTHVLAFGWSTLVRIIPPAEKSEIVRTIQDFRNAGWFSFTFVRHPGELLTSFYYYILDAHERGWHASVARHAPAVDRTLDEFVAEHCEKELLPDYWREFDYAGEASDAAFATFFARYFGHTFKASARSHASGSRGYARYVQTGEISAETAARVERSRNMEIYREIVASSQSRDSRD